MNWNLFKNEEEKIAMSEIYNIPILYTKGVYSFSELPQSESSALALRYEERGDIVTYRLPDREYGTVTLYGIKKELLDSFTCAEYDDSGALKTVSVAKNDGERLLYIRYEDTEHSRAEIGRFAIDNANAIVEKISACKEPVARLFVECFDDGEYMDFHVKIGTQAQTNALLKKHGLFSRIADSCGDYASDIIAGDNDRLKIMVSCADNDEFDHFGLAVDIMTGLIKEKAAEKLNTSKDFKIICAEYD